MSETANETPGEALHRLLHTQWGGHVPMGTGDYVDHADGWSSLGDTAREGWEEIAGLLLTWHIRRRESEAEGVRR